ncbi:Fic family protein [Acetobacter sicerae]|uniref:Fic family protein n=1 Tax=Acetobacter sicerae TaxID=85325 RepID=UPI00156B5BDF|nr:Fic family protein [Acetobacter sicerae]NHN93544.1 hypothetical protein [Acetobacter sicerae]
MTNTEKKSSDSVAPNTPVSLQSGSRLSLDGLLSRVRITELERKPLTGSFDLDHLKKTHAYIFQDFDHYPGAVQKVSPGQVRGDSRIWMKPRTLEGTDVQYDVMYATQHVGQKASEALETFHQLGGVKELAGLSLREAGNRLADLYADLDYAHVFEEGNSRTLRSFVRSVARKAGFDLDWTRTGVTQESRNQLYVARDVAVIERAFPGMTEARALEDEGMGYMAFQTLTQLRELQGKRDLGAIISAGLTRLEPTPQATPEIQSGRSVFGRIVDSFFRKPATEVRQEPSGVAPEKAPSPERHESPGPSVPKPSDRSPGPGF